MSRVVYRIVVENPPSESDFKSYVALGQQPKRMRPDLMDLMSGLSVMDTAGSARHKALKSPWRGRAWISVHVLDDTIRVEKTARDPHHYTVWASAE